MTRGDTVLPILGAGEVAGALQLRRRKPRFIRLPQPTDAGVLFRSAHKISFPLSYTPSRFTVAAFVTNLPQHATQRLQPSQPRHPVHQRVPTLHIHSDRAYRDRTILRICWRVKEEGTQWLELSGWRKACLVPVLAVLAQSSCCITSEVIASSNTNILSHRVFEREEAFVCFVCRTTCLDRLPSTTRHSARLHLTSNPSTLFPSTLPFCPSCRCQLLRWRPTFAMLYKI